MPTPDLEALRKQLHEVIDLAISDYDLKIEANLKECMAEFDQACKLSPKDCFRCVPWTRAH